MSKVGLRIRRWWEWHQIRGIQTQDARSGKVLFSMRSQLSAASRGWKRTVLGTEGKAKYPVSLEKQQKSESEECEERGHLERRLDLKDQGLGLNPYTRLIAVDLSLGRRNKDVSYFC